MNEKLKIQLANYAGAYKSMVVPPAPAVRPSNPVLTENEKKVFIEAEKAWASYSNSPEGKKDLAAAENMDLPELRAYVASLPDKPVFKKLITWIRSLALPDGSFSIGLNAEVELIIGISGTIGVAIGVGSSKGVQSSEFLSVS